jgi:serine/threonine protein kinase/Flp pilus assembly protein TadD
MLTSGSTFGNFTVEEIIGSGAMGVIYKARDIRNNQTVALKLIEDKLSRSTEYRSRLTREAEAAGKIDSPNVVKVWEHAEFENQPYISMEYVPGEDLRTVAENYSFKEKIELVLQIGEGLKAAHVKEVVHRDLKPENIKVTDDNQAKILDFGLAKTVNADSVDPQGNIEGTLYYLSPEQITGESTTVVSDIFSYGVILYELFTDQRPFESDYSAAIIYSILHEDPPAPCDVKTDLPGWFDVLVMKLLAKQPTERYESMQAVLEYIKDCMSGEPEKMAAKCIQTRQTVTVIDLKNLSDDESWEYFCVGFTDDLISELSRRTDLIISAEPSSVYARNIREVFRRCRSDFVIVGSLIKWQEKIKMNLNIYGQHGENLISGQKYEADSQDIFKVLSQAVEDTSAKLAETTGFSSIDVEDYFKTDIAAYEYYLKGKNYYQTNKPDNLKIAERMFRKALEIDPDLAYAYSGLSDVYAFQYMAYYDRSQERIDKAREQAMKAIEISPNLPEAHRSLGRYHMFMGAFDEAEKSFLKAIEINPKYAIGYRTLAWLKEISGHHENAIEWAKMSLKYAPNDTETLLLLSLINMDLGKYTVAMATLQRAIELVPDYGRAYYNLGLVYEKLGVHDLALENYLEAIKYKGDPNAYVEAGYIYMVSKEYDKARATLEESIIEGCFPFIAFYYLGYTEKMCQNVDKAREYFKKAAKSAEENVLEDEENVHIKAYQAMALAAAGKNDEAVLILKNLESIQHEDGEVLYEMAQAYATLGNEIKAREFIGKAVTTHAGPSEKQININPHFAGMLKVSVDKAV